MSNIFDIRNAPLTFKECLNAIVPPFLDRYQPNIEYAILDVGRVSDVEISKDSNIISLIVGLEQADTRERLLKVLAKIEQELKADKFNRIRRDFFVYLTRAIRVQDRFPQINLDTIGDLNTMLCERFDQWEREIEIEREIEREIKEKEIKETESKTKHQERLSLLNSLLTKKWGKIPHAALKKMETAPNDTLQHWLDRAVQDESLDELI